MLFFNIQRNNFTFYIAINYQKVSINAKISYHSIQKLQNWMCTFIVVSQKWIHSAINYHSFLIFSPFTGLIWTLILAFKIAIENNNNIKFISLYIITNSISHLKFISFYSWFVPLWPLYLLTKRLLPPPQLCYHCLTITWDMADILSMAMALFT